MSTNNDEQTQSTRANGSHGNSNVSNVGTPNDCGIGEPESSVDTATATGCCPICLQEFGSSGDKSGGDQQTDHEQSCLLQLAHGPCGHVFCLPCLERHLLAPRRSMSHLDYDSQTTTSSSSSPVTIALGQCPMCRSELSYFDCVLYPSGKSVCTAQDDAAWKAFVSTEPVYVDVAEQEHEGGGVGLASWHFCLGLNKRSFCNMEQVPFRHPAEPVHWYLDDVTSARYHAKTRTFSGQVTFSIESFPSTARIFTDLRVIFSFSPDGRFITQGVIVRRRRRFDSLEDLQRVYPLDGKWSVVVATNEDRTSISTETSSTSTTTVLLVTRNRTCNNFMVDFSAQSDDSHIRLLGPLHNSGLPVAQTASFDFRSQPLGPGLGQVLEWCRPLATIHDGDDTTDTDSAARAVIVERWTRLSFLEPDALTSLPKASVLHIGGRSGNVYKRLPRTSPELLQQQLPPTYRADSIWGNTFCQLQTVGYASYHFINSPPSDENATTTTAICADHVGAYISYEHSATRHWPPLDNGMPIPDRVYFHNVRQPNAHTFRGDICWLQDYGTTWQGCRQWEYEMHFDSQFVCIIAGRVTSVMGGDEYYSGEHERRDLSVFGQELLYCNAAIFEVFRPHIGTTTTNGDGIAQRDSLRRQLLRLQREGATELSLAKIDLVWNQSMMGRNPMVGPTDE
jgi:hypothetical protein